MKTDFNSIKKELEKLTDVDYLKQELNRVKTEIKKFDINVHLTPQAKAKLRGLENSFEELRGRVVKLQKQVDTEIAKFVSIVRKARGGDAATSGKKATSRKKTSTKSATAKKTSKKTSAKK